MRAVRAAAPGTAALVELPDPGSDDGNVVVRVTWAAVCATDRKIVRRGVVEPRVLGHEFAGERADGTPVVVHPDIGCGGCARCRAGWTNRCDRRRSIGIDRDGGFAGRAAVPAGQLVSLDGIAPYVGAMLEPLACCVHAVGLLPADGVRSAAVVGAGAMGVLAMWTLQARGLPVTVVQRSQPRRRLAATLGADAVLGPDERPSEAPDVVVVTAPGGEALAWATDHVAVGGAIHAFAGTPGGAQADANAVHYRHLTLLGSTGSTVDDMRRAARLVRDGDVPLADLPRTTIGLAALPDALTTDPDPEHLRTLVDLGGHGS